MRYQRVSTLFLPLLLFFLAACNNDPVPTLVPTVAIAATASVSGEATVVTEATAAVVSPTATPIPPTPTPAEPMAALVNDEPVYLSTYEKELARYEQAQTELGLSPGAGEADYHALVLDALIEKTLITQAAETRGIEITPAMVDARIAELQEAVGSVDNFTAWREANQWTDEEEFREALRDEMLTAELVATVTADVPYAVEQVRARYLQVDDAALAQELLQRARNGDDFAFLAEQHSLDRVTAQNGGDLGFFAAGSLLVPEVEAAAFALQPGEVSDVVTVTDEGSGQTTYYLVKVIERDLQRPLPANMRYTILQQTFEEWLAEQWAQANITRFVNTDT